MINTLLQKLERLQPFTDQEAWTLFKLAAVGEAVGWSLLIAGILCQRFITPGNNDAVLIAGQIHGTIFLIYLAAVVVLYSSLHWSRKRTIVAGLASIPPYGSLLFEQWAAHQRRSAALQTYREVTVRAIIIQDDKLLAIQPKENNSWQLPGGLVQADESAEQALHRLITGQTGVTLAIARLAYVLQYRHHSTQQLALFFVIANVSDFKESKLLDHLKNAVAIDEIRYVQPENNRDLQPAFLRTEPIIQTARKTTEPVRFITV